MIKIQDRQTRIAQRVKNKKVLNIGCVGYIEGRHNPRTPWLHHTIHKNAKETWGIDNDTKGIQKMKQAGYKNIHEANANNFNLNQKFDIIIAGEIIEHLTNFDTFFQSIKKHMTKKTTLIITTPNPYKITNIARILAFGKTYGHPEHTIYHDEHTLKEMLHQEGLKTIKTEYDTQLAPQKIRNTLIRTLGHFIPIYNLTLMNTSKLKWKQQNLLKNTNLK